MTSQIHMSIRPWRLLLVLLVLGSQAWLSSCAVSEDSARSTPPPTPSPRDVYLMISGRYTSWQAIWRVHEMSAGEAARTLSALKDLQVPTDLEHLHEMALDGYRHGIVGKLLLPTRDPLVRAEGYFLVDWGISLLVEHRQGVDALNSP